MTLATAAVLDEHRGYLSDRHRMAAYEAAIAAVVRPSDVVVDLGAGSGVLGMLALRAGARRVFAIEALATMALTRRLYEANGFAERAVFVRGWASDVTLPEPADVVVCDQAGSFGFGAGLFEALAVARRRFLKPGGRLVPAHIALELGALEAPALHEGSVAFWTSTPTGLDMGPAHALAANAARVARLAPEMLLGPAARGAEIVLGDDVPELLSLEVRVPVERDGVLHGLGGWFVATLAPGVSLSNDPRRSDRIDRPGMYFPIERGAAVRAGDEIAASVMVRPREEVIAWRLDIGRPGEGVRMRLAHSTLAGMLLGREELALVRPASAPRLSPRGQAERLVLELVDGVRPVRAIEEALVREHGALFPTAASAGVFVSRVLARAAGSAP